MERRGLQLEEKKSPQSRNKLMIKIKIQPLCISYLYRMCIQIDTGVGVSLGFVLCACAVVCYLLFYILYVSYIIQLAVYSYAHAHESMCMSMDSRNLQPI